MTAAAAIERELTGDRLRDFAETVRGRVKGLSHDDAEDAISVAVSELLEKEPDHIDFDRPLGGLIVNLATWRAKSVKERAEARNLSLDAFAESDEDHRPVEVAVTEDQLDVHLELREYEGHPIMADRLRAASVGAAPIVAPRGASSHAARYSDEQVEEVRRLRNEEGMKFADIAEATGVEKSYCAQICRGRARLLPATEGWTEARMIEAIEIFARREKRAPTYQEAQQRADLPNPSIACERWGVTWRTLLDRAGVPSSREWRRCAPWTRAEADRAFWDFFEQNGYWPRTKEELRNPLPSAVTSHKLYGTWRVSEIGRILEAEANGG